MTNKGHPGRVALVTGAARGIGAATAIALAQRGIAPVLLVRDPAAAEATQQAVLAHGVTCGVLQADVAEAAQVQQAVAQLLREYGRLDVLVNNAGQIDPIGRIADTDPAVWARAIEVNLLGPYLLIHATLPALLASRRAALEALWASRAEAVVDPSACAGFRVQLLALVADLQWAALIALYLEADRLRQED